MNLPNYFLADLPPEASLTAGIISEACQTLKRNRELYLLSRSTQSLIELFSRVAKDWLDPESPFRKLALAEGPAATGFSQATLTTGLDAFFQGLTPEVFQALIEQDLGHVGRLDQLDASQSEQKTNRASIAVGPELLVHVAAGNLPNPAFISIILGVLT